MRSLGFLLSLIFVLIILNICSTPFIQWIFPYNSSPIADIALSPFLTQYSVWMLSPNLLESVCTGLPFPPFLPIESETLCWATIPLLCECLLLSALETLTALPFPVMWTRHHPAHCHFSPPCRSSPHSARAIELHDRPISCKVFFPHSAWTMKLYYPSGTPLSHALGLQKPVLGHCCHLIYTTSLMPTWLVLSNCQNEFFR